MSEKLDKEMSKISLNEENEMENNRFNGICGKCFY